MRIVTIICDEYECRIICFSDDGYNLFATGKTSLIIYSNVVTVARVQSHVSYPQYNISFRRNCTIWTVAELNGGKNCNILWNGPTVGFSHLTTRVMLYGY